VIPVHGREGVRQILFRIGGMIRSLRIAICEVIGKEQCLKRIGGKVIGGTNGG
jgi:hypothetical protein